MDGKRLTRRAALGLVGSGAFAAITNTAGLSTTDAARSTTLGVDADPTAVLGIEGFGSDPRSEVTVSNNASTELTVTVSTTNFTIENDGDGGSDREWTFSLQPGASQTVEFFQEDGNQDDVGFAADIRNGADEVVGHVDLTRTITIPVQTNTLYRIRAFHSDLYLAPGGSASWDNNVVQTTYAANGQQAQLQQWDLESNGDGTTSLRNVGTGDYMTIGTHWSSSYDPTVIVESQNANTDQHWNLSVDPEGRYVIESESTPGEVVDVAGDSTSDGADVILWPREPTTDQDDMNQKFIFESV